MQVEEVTVDARELEPPEPFEQVTAALNELNQGQYVRMISRRRPFLLYPWLEEEGFSEITVDQEDETYELYIWAKDDAETSKAISSIIP
jgi:uncharacterized protein (DUF2249 family)